MSITRVLAPVIVMVLAATILVVVVERELSAAWFRLGVQPQVMSLLEKSMADQKRLDTASPGNDGLYRRRYEEIHRVLNNLRVLEHSRSRIVSRYQAVLLAVLGLVVVAGSTTQVLGQAREHRRLSSIQDALQALSGGGVDLEVPVRGRDGLGRVARMVESTSRLVGRQRKRLEAMRTLEQWQDTTRRISHQLSGPLNAARLELSRLHELLGGTSDPGDALACASNIDTQLDRLGRWTRSFARLGRLPEPRLVADDVAGIVQHFEEVFSSAWPGLHLAMDLARPARAMVDRDLLEHLLTNLADNAARAMGGAGGTLGLAVSTEGQWVRVDVADSGPGLPADVVDRLFQPYVSRKERSDGMGLGLAIAHKIALDHGGDLRLFETSEQGTTFSLVLPVLPCNSEVE
ncbi:MAG: HAMP domain-containing histidine kinase [Acidobacteria bacterium]|nr:HAMP domain-containing histidine kinase [Acidobacteriota bacterium]